MARKTLLCIHPLISSCEDERFHVRVHDAHNDLSVFTEALWIVKFSAFVVLAR
jgi:hypothetical protein